MCVKSMGVASGCGFKDLFSSYYLSLLLLYLFFFAAASLFLVNVFFVFGISWRSKFSVDSLMASFMIKTCTHYDAGFAETT